MKLLDEKSRDTLTEEYCTLMDLLGMFQSIEADFD
jgi:hypothetical protein